MSTTTDGGTAAYLTTPRGTLCPRVVTEEWLNRDPERNMIVAEIALATHAILPADDGWTYAVLMLMVEAVQDGGALVCQYRNCAGIVTARVLYPASVTVTAERHLTAQAWCTARRAVRTFRLDAVLDCHPLALPHEGARPPAVVRFAGVGAFGTVATVTEVMERC